MDTAPFAAVTRTLALIKHIHELIERFACQCKGSAALLEGDCSVADARQGTTLSVLGALHSPPINTADRFATLTLTRKPL